MDVLAICTSKAHQKQGLGRKLLLHAMHALMEKQASLQQADVRVMMPACLQRSKPHTHIQPITHVSCFLSR